jgi:hypothetical protein
LGEGGLLEKIGIVKTCVERKKKRVEGVYAPGSTCPANRSRSSRRSPVERSIRTGQPMHQRRHARRDAGQFPDYYVPLEEFRERPTPATWIARFISAT